AELAELVTALGVCESVEVHGTIARDEVLRAMAECRLAVSCSSFEAFGLPVGEALAIGAPVAASDIPAHRELLHRAGVGASFRPGDHGALARLLRDALRGDAPPRLAEPPRGWSWRERASEHVDVYLRHS
ncbi:MAG TPA: glycosyltransferase, partial [Gemmatimonadaceae bacterium]|nr:glycosyltransferase [Gemmatimonadaceae bacterium]